MLVWVPFFIFGVMKRISKAIFFLVVLFSTGRSAGQKVYDFDGNCKLAYQDITSLKLDQGAALLNQERLRNPDNLIPDLLEGYIDFFELFFNEDPAAYAVKKQSQEARIERLEQGPQNSPYYNYCLSVAYLQKATVAIKFGERWSAAWAFRKAFGLIKANRKAFPGFLPNDMIYGPMEVVVDVIPDGYKWFTSLLGMKGSVKDGMERMHNFVYSNDPTAKFFFNEATFYYCYLLFYIQNQPDAVFDFINEKKLDVVNNHLFAYLAANLGINDKRTEYAKNILLHKNPSPDYMYTPVWDYEMAFVRLHHLELGEATRYFENFLHNFKGKFYLKDSYEKLAWCYYLQGDTKDADEAMQEVLTKGNLETDADKQALADAQSGIWPNKILLRARLLSDGGYNSEALAALNGKSTDDFSVPDDKLEFAYRVARIYDDMGRDSDAIQAYLAAIKLGTGSKQYYASRAALQIGYIYEREGKKALAIVFFNQCISMKNHEYKDSIDQKAKAGIARCEDE